MAEHGDHADQVETGVVEAADDLKGQNLQTQRRAMTNLMA